MIPSLLDKQFATLEHFSHIGWHQISSLLHQQSQFWELSPISGTLFYHLTTLFKNGRFLRCQSGGERVYFR